MTLFSFITYLIFLPIFEGSEIIITYGFNPFDICQESPELWNFIKKSFFFFSSFSYFILGNFAFSFACRFFSKFRHSSNIHSNSFIISNEDCLHLVIGEDISGNVVTIPENGLYQNFLITGTIGSGKTSSAMYPFTKQLISFCSNYQKMGMLILDVKGNYYQYVDSLCNRFGLIDDLIVISLNSNVFYNPLDKPNLKPQVLANRLKTILLLFSENNSESFWLDKAEEVLCECIKLCRLYNDGYVTFLELHKLIFYSDYYKEKLSFLRQLFVSNKLSKHQVYDLNSCLNFFQKDFENLDQRTLAILKSEIGRITNVFVSDYDVLNTFSPPRDKISFNRFFRGY